MTSNALNTFGAILSFAIDLEGALQHFYDHAQQATADDLNELFEDYARKAGKRKQRLTAIRQENVTEMVLEAITGLDEADYLLKASEPKSVPDAVEEALRLEARVEKFYSDAGPKLNVTEPRRAFQKFAQEAADRSTELKETDH